MTGAQPSGDLTTWIDEVHAEWTQARPDRKQRSALAAEVERYIRRDPDLNRRLHRVTVHGSSANGLAAADADLDLTVLFYIEHADQQPLQIQPQHNPAAQQNANQHIDKQELHSSPRNVLDAAAAGPDAEFLEEEMSPLEQDRRRLIGKVAWVLWADMRVRYKIYRLKAENVKVPLVKMTPRYPEISSSGCPPIDIAVDFVDPVQISRTGAEPLTDQERHSKYLSDMLVSDAKKGGVFEKCAIYIKVWARTNGIWAGFSGLPSHVLVMLLVKHMHSEGYTVQRGTRPNRQPADYIWTFFLRYTQDFPTPESWYCCPVTGKSMYPGPTGQQRLQQECRKAVMVSGGRIGPYATRLEYEGDLDL